MKVVIKAILPVFLEKRVINNTVFSNAIFTVLMVWCGIKRRRLFRCISKLCRTFGGERTDPATGWQFLGNGNRTYNPAQRYFLSEDPAGDGYAFGSNNPIMNTDPSGNSSRWLGEIFKWAGYVSTMGLSALHQRWANITAAVIQTGCTVATLGAVAAGAGSAALASIVAVYGCYRQHSCCSCRNTCK